MKKITIVSVALCLSILASGCTTNEPAQASKPTTVTTAEETTKAAHQVNVEVVTLQSSADGDQQVVPKITVDGVEAAEINNTLSSYIQTEYPLDIYDDYADGMATKIYWGVKDNVLTIVIHAHETFTDYFTYDVFNYDLDTLKAMDDSEVVKSLGMTDEEFISKTSEIVKNFCSERDYDLDKSLAAVGYENCTPFVTPDGTPGVAASIYFPADSQFGGGASLRCFNMATMEPVNFA